MRFTGSITLLLAVLFAHALHADELRRGDVLVAAQQHAEAFDGVHGFWVKLDYFVDHYDAHGDFVSRVLSGPPLPNDAQAQGLMSQGRSILFAEDQHSLRWIGLDGSAGASFAGHFNWAIAMAGDAAGGVLVAEHFPFSGGEVLRHDPAGLIVDRYPIDVWFSMDLAKDRCTLVYPEFHRQLIGGDLFDEWLSISRYDLCTHTPLPAVIERWPDVGVMQLRILPDDGLLILDTGSVQRYDARGVQLWRVPDVWFSPFVLALDPTGWEFWAATMNGTLSRFSARTGERLLGPIKMWSSEVPLSGTVVGEWRAAQNGRARQELPAKER
jgi:hypothetical protein